MHDRRTYFDRESIVTRFMDHSAARTFSKFQDPTKQQQVFRLPTSDTTKTTRELVVVDNITTESG
jgi:hypothetical protein